MRLVQKQKEEVPSLPLWLGRDVPHERKLARELLDTMGREKSLDYLLHLHDREETRRQKRLIWYTTALYAYAIAATLGSGFGLYLITSSPLGVNSPWLRVCVAFFWVGSVVVNLFNLGLWRGRRKKTPWFSSAVQQNVITSLLDYADNPLAADALSRATVYYTGDRSRLFEQLAHLLPLLPDDPTALTKYARHALIGRLSPIAASHYPGEKERLPALRPAITRYFARTGKPAARSKKDAADGEQGKNQRHRFNDQAR